MVSGLENYLHTFAFGIILISLQFSTILLIRKGIELTDKERFVQFEVASADKGCTVQELIIKQILLGADAKDDEFNVVQVNFSFVIAN